MTQKTNSNPWTMDVRVRERNLKSGALGPKDLEKYLAQLPDLADQVEPFATPQPAFEPPVVAEAAPEAPAPAVVAPEVSAPSAEAPAAAAPVVAAPEAAAPSAEAPAAPTDGRPVTNGEGTP